jgi:hypothetical protein
VQNKKTVCCQSPRILKNVKESSRIFTIMATDP